MWIAGTEAKYLCRVIGGLRNLPTAHGTYSMRSPSTTLMLETYGYGDFCFFIPIGNSTF